jgi:hypothetical protein
MFVIDDAFLAAVAHGVVEAVVALVVEGLVPKDRIRRFLGRDPQRLAFQGALKQALVEFNARHPDYGGSLIQKTFLTGAAAPILAQCLVPGAEPDPHGLVVAWVSQPGVEALPSREEWIALAEAVAADFLRLFSRNLRARDEFRLLFDSHALDATAEQTAETAAALRRLNELVEDIFDWLRTRAKITAGFDGVWTRLAPPARHQIRPVLSRRAGDARRAQPLVKFPH